MLESSRSLYKLIVLFMLGKVSFPMTNAQISDLVLSLKYTGYFNLQEVLAEMISSSLLETEHRGHTTYYLATEQGRQTLRFFEGEISPEIRSEIASYLEEHAYEIRSESSTRADYSRESDGSYLVNGVVMEGSRTLISVNISVPTESMARTLAENWKAKSQEAYEAVMKTLM